VVAGFNQQEKQIELWSLDVLSLQLGNHLEHLHESEVFLAVVLHGQSGAPHVNPSNVNVGAFSSADIGDVNFVSVEQRLKGLFALGPVLSLKFVFQIGCQMLYIED